jgi:hypothetical protein
MKKKLILRKKVSQFLMATVFKIGIFLISCVNTHYCSEQLSEAPFQVLLALGYRLGCTVSGVAGSGLQ